MRVVSATGGNTLTYLQGDQLGSTSLTTDPAGNSRGLAYYSVWGGINTVTGGIATDRLYTGKRQDASANIYDYGARFYYPTIGQFISADTIVPQPGDPQSLNRYSYARNSPLKYKDPTGHCYTAGTPNTVPSQWCGEENPVVPPAAGTPSPINLVPSPVPVATPYVPSTPLPYVAINVAPPVRGEPYPAPPQGTGLPDDGWDWNGNWPQLGPGWRNRHDPDGAVWRPDIRPNEKGAKEGEDPHWHKRVPGRSDEKIPPNPEWGRGTNDRSQPGTYNPDTGRYEALSVSLNQDTFLYDSSASFYVSANGMGSGTFYTLVAAGIIGGGAAGVYYWQQARTAFH